jgi:exodeoxyribonuclease V alpha subunit
VALGLEGEASPADLPAPVREALVRADLGEAQAHLAWELARLAVGLSPDEHLALLAVVLLTQEALGRGSTRVPCDARWLSEQAVAIGFDATLPSHVTAIIDRAQSHNMKDALSRIFGVPGDRRPLVIDGAHLYQQRLHALEERLASLLRARVHRPSSPPPELDAVLASIDARPSGKVVLTDEQREAVRAALASPLSVVSGGPGTGKTSIVVAILRAAVATGVDPASIALAAPTGKAADRMRRSIESALTGIAEPLEPERTLIAALPRPMTLHRLLGYSPSRGGFRHHGENPLSERLVIVDESSMIDVFLMERLAASLLPSARLVLLGDAEQLPSVAAGAVFRDLGRAHRVPSVMLTKSHRMDPRLPEGFNILSVAARINRGERPDLAGPRMHDGVQLPERPDALGVLADLPEGPDRIGGVFLFEPHAPLDRERFLDYWLEHHARGPRPLARLAHDTWPRVEGRIEGAAADALEPLFAHTERARLLAVTRSGARPTGVEALNASLHRRFAEDRRASGPLLVAGEPVLVQRNDYERGLFNGDQGLVLWTAGDDESPRLSAVFRADRGFVAHPLEAVRASIDLGFVTTVHKAQGSEHDTVALILPETDSPRLLTREIVYTAITRARRSVLIVGSPELLARAAVRRVERSTGIADRLRDAPLLE